MFLRYTSLIQELRLVPTLQLRMQMGVNEASSRPIVESQIVEHSTINAIKNIAQSRREREDQKY